MKRIPYRYRNLPVPGGGYVTGFLFHPGKEKILYIRTDIGGSYRYDYEKEEWISLTQSVNMFDLSETYPIALAVDAGRPKRLLIASGTDQSVGERARGKLSISEDYGKTFIHREIPCYVHGNCNGRGTGLRLVMDPAAEEGLYFASQKDGLWYSPDLGNTWRQLEVCGEKYMTFLFVSPDGRILVAGTAGVSRGTARHRGHSLYVSTDRGAHFEPLPMPEQPKIPESVWNGYVAQRYDYDGTSLYVTLSCTGAHSYVKEMGYSCDSGDALGGKILRYTFHEDGNSCTYKDITPEEYCGESGSCFCSRKESLPFGFGGISSCPVMPGLLAASTFCKEDGDVIFLSRDYGESWETALYDLSVGNLHFCSPYMKPAYNGGHSLLHWLSDIKINPFDPEEVWFNSGTGVFRGQNFTKAERSFCDCCRGLEETVHLNVYSLPSGPVQVLDILGDLGGFAFTELDQPCENSFADQEGNRYITCINADFSDLTPNWVLVTPRGNWKGKTRGGLILSSDYGQSFTRIPLPYGISDYLDERFREIERPNVNAGWCALSADARSIVYGVAEGIDLFMKGIIVSCDQGKSFQKTRIFNARGEEVTNSSLHMKVFSDRMKASVFYGFGDDFTLYISTDGGVTFLQAVTEGFPEADPEERAAYGKAIFGLIDCANKTEVRGEAGKEGIFYVAVGKYGLYRLAIDAAVGCARGRRITEKGDCVYRMGLGLLRRGGNYAAEEKALYICGVLAGCYGFFRSLDGGESWEKLNEENQQFGDINSIDGDCRCFGRYFIATGSFGLKYGEPADDGAQD